MRIAHRETVILENEAEQVWGVLHLPLEPPTGPRPAVAIFHGLLGSKSQPRLLVRVADALAQVGIVALRIDFRGRGDSEGDSLEITPRRDLADAKRALDYLEGLPHTNETKLGLLGLSWGGAIAALLAGGDARVARTVLWNAVADVHDWQPAFQEREGQPVVEMWGHLLSQRFYDGTRDLFPRQTILNTTGRVLIVQSTEDEAIANPVESAKTLLESLHNSGVRADLVLLEGADHAIMRHDAATLAIQETVRWLLRSFEAPA